MDGTDNIVVLADIADLQRLDGWSSDEASVLELTLEPDAKTDAGMRAVTDKVGHIALEKTGEDDDTLIATSVISRYPQIFDWLNLIDFNVLFILVLMTIVAGFNMISGLLIMLFRNISTIGTLKSLGMTDKAIAKRIPEGRFRDCLPRNVGRQRCGFASVRDPEMDSPHQTESGELFRAVRTGTPQFTCGAYR